MKRLFTSFAVALVVALMAVSFAFADQAHAATHDISKNETPGGTVMLVDSNGQTSKDTSVVTMHPQAGAMVYFRTIPEPGYTLTRMSYTPASTGTPIGLQRIMGNGRPGTTSVYCFKMPNCDVTLNATFGTYTLNVNKNIAGSGQAMLVGSDGKTSASATMYPKRGETVYFKSIPGEGYKLSTLNITYWENGKKVTRGLTKEGASLYSFVMPNCDVSLNATFKPYTLTVRKNVYGNGDLMLVGSNGQPSNSATLHPKKGDVVYFKATAGKGYKLAKCNITFVDNDGNEVLLGLTRVGNGVYSFVMPDYNVDVNAIYELKPVSSPGEWTPGTY